MKTQQQLIRKSEIERLVVTLLSDSVSAGYVLEHWPSGPALNAEEERLSYEIRHYAEDADIRAKDAASDPGNTTYKDYQISLIRKYLTEYIDNQN